MIIVRVAIELNKKHVIDSRGSFFLMRVFGNSLFKHLGNTWFNVVLYRGSLGEFLWDPKIKTTNNQKDKN